jgi:stress response protein SCP2
MASNIIKDLEIDIGNVYELIQEALITTIENITIEGVGDDQNTNFDTEEVKVEYKDGKFLATIYLQRTEGKFVQNSELEEAVITAMSNEKMTVEVEIQA